MQWLGDNGYQQDPASEPVLEPDLDVDGVLIFVDDESHLDVAIDALTRSLAQHDQARTRCSSPAFLRRRDENVDSRLTHVDPQRTRCNAVEHEEAPDFMNGRSDAAQIVVGQQDSRGRLRAAS